MPFLFLKYLQPTHYFRLKTRLGLSVFPKVEYLPDAVKNKMPKDFGYESDAAQNYDLSWRVIQCGYIGDVEVYTDFEKITLRDNYRFARKNFHPAWVFYVLILRILTFHNPFFEMGSWFKTRHVKQSTEFKNPIGYQDWSSYESPLIKRNPKVSVVIPTLNRYHFLKDILWDLEKQDYKNFEVIVLDQSDTFDQDFYTAYDLDIKLKRQEEKALWLARNTGVKYAKGEFIALSEDDVRIDTNWISSHLKSLDFFDAQVSAGVFYPEGQTLPKARSFFAVASQFATGNAMLYKSVFNKVGLFDRQFEKQRMGDGEFGLRLYLEGVKAVSNPKASCVDVKAGTGGLRDMGSWDAFRPASFFAPRPIPSVLYFFRRYFGNKASVLSLLRMVPLSIFPYQFKKNKPLMVVGLLITLLLFPIVCFQVLKSWHLASIKLKQGSQIAWLNGT